MKSLHQPGDPSSAKPITNTLSELYYVELTLSKIFSFSTFGSCPSIHFKAVDTCLYMHWPSFTIYKTKYSSDSLFSAFIIMLPSQYSDFQTFIFFYGQPFFYTFYYTKSNYLKQYHLTIDTKVWQPFFDNPLHFLNVSFFLAIKKNSEKDIMTLLENESVNIVLGVDGWVFLLFNGKCLTVGYSKSDGLLTVHLLSIFNDFEAEVLSLIFSHHCDVDIIFAKQYFFINELELAIRTFL